MPKASAERRVFRKVCNSMKYTFRKVCNLKNRKSEPRVFLEIRTFFTNNLTAQKQRLSLFIFKLFNSKDE